MKKNILMLGLSLLFAFTACSEIDPKGVISDSGLYVNEKYGFQLQLPEPYDGDGVYSDIFSFVENDDPDYPAQFGIYLGNSVNLLGFVYTKQSEYVPVTDGESGFEKIKINNYDALKRSSYGTSNSWFISTVFFGDKYVYEFQFSSETKDQKYIDIQDEVLKSFQLSKGY